MAAFCSIMLSTVSYCDEVKSGTENMLAEETSPEGLQIAADEAKYLSYMVAAINWNLQWCSYWHLWQVKHRRNLEFVDQAWQKLDHNAITSSIGPSNRLVLNEITDISGEGGIKGIYQQLTKLVLVSVNLSFEQGFQFGSLFASKGSAEPKPEDFPVFVNKFVFPFNVSILLQLPDLGFETNMLQTKDVPNLCKVLRVDDQLVKLVDLKRKWHLSAKIAIIKQALQSAAQEKRSLDVNRGLLDDYCSYVLSFVLPQTPSQASTGCHITAGLLMNEIVGIVKKLGLDALDSQLIECLLCQTFYCSYFVSESPDKSLVEKLCYVLVSSLGFKTWQDILKRQSMWVPTISKAEHDEAAEFLCKVGIIETATST